MAPREGWMAQRKPLGRGLEQLSRAFLTEPEPEPAAEPPPQAPVPPPIAGRAPAAGPLVLLHAAHASRERITAALRQLAGELEPGLRILDESLPCDPCGAIDLLAVDGTGRLMVVDLETVTGDELLIRGLGHVDWMIGNVPILRRMFRGHSINFSLPPRLCLLAPAFSPRMRYAARQAASPEIEWVRYHVVQAPGSAGIFLERLPPA